MKNEFREAYTKLFENSLTNLRRIIQVKLKAIRFSKKYMWREPDHQPSFKTFGGLSCQSMENTMKKFNFEPIDQNEIEDCSSNIASTSESHDDSQSLSGSSFESDCDNSVAKSNKRPRVSFRKLVFKNEQQSNQDIKHIREQLTKKLVKNFALELYQREKMGADDDEAKK